MVFHEFLLKVIYDINKLTSLGTRQKSLGKSAEYNPLIIYRYSEDKISFSTGKNCNTGLLLQLETSKIKLGTFLRFKLFQVYTPSPMLCLIIVLYYIYIYRYLLKTLNILKSNMILHSKKIISRLLDELNINITFY